MNRNKRNRYKSLILETIKQFNQKQLILVQGENSKKGHLIYLTQKGSFQVILYKMIRFLSGKLKKHTKLAKIAIFINRLVFPLNLNQFNRFSHTMTLRRLSTRAYLEFRGRSNLRKAPVALNISILTTKNLCLFLGNPRFRH